MGDIKKTSHDGYIFFIGVGPRLDFKLKSVVVTYVDFDEHRPSDFEPDCFSVY